MRKSSIGLLVSVVLVTAAATSCSDSGGGGTGKGGGAGTSSAGGRGGTTGTGGGGTTGTGGGGTTGTGGGGTTGTGGGGTTGTGGGGTTGTGGGGTTGTGGIAGVGGNAGRGGGGGATAGTGGGAAGTGGGAAGTGGGAAGTGGGAAGTGGGAAGTGGGAAGTGGGIGGGGGMLPLAPLPPTTGTATRPQLTAAAAPDYTILKYLAKGGPLLAPTTDNWDPTAGVGDVATFTATYTVAASGGTHTTVQAALTAAMTAGGTNRIYIQVMPGTYREQVCVLSGSPPITLYSTTADASQTVIIGNHYSGEAKANGTPANACNPNLTGTTYGTSGSATFAAYAAGFQAKNITFANDFDETGMTNNLQAVALMTQGDKLIFENVRMLGNQDTLYVKSNSVDNAYRAYFKGCYVEGDVDFIFGRAVMVLDGCTINYTSARRGASNGGNVISPSTDARNLYGTLIISSTFTADGATNAGTVFLGRAWDEGGTSGATVWPATAGATNYPNGQAVIRQTTLGAHIIGAAPWNAAASTGRPYSSTATTAFPANRLFEYMNTGAGAAP